jgi:hypothetical protein
MTSDNFKEQYGKARATAKEAVEAARKVAKEAFRQEATEIIDELGIKNFGWVQYTPYFNDGDACVFSVSVSSSDRSVYGVEINQGYDEDAEEDEDDDGYGEQWGGRNHGYYPDDDEEGFKKAKRIADFILSFDEDDLLWMFDDHAHITIWRDREEVDDYSHD